MYQELYINGNNDIIRSPNTLCLSLSYGVRKSSVEIPSWIEIQQMNPSFKCVSKLRPFSELHTQLMNPFSEMHTPPIAPILPWRAFLTVINLLDNKHNWNTSYHTYQNYLPWYIQISKFGIPMLPHSLPLMQVSVYPCKFTHGLWPYKTVPYWQCRLN